MVRLNGVILLFFCFFMKNCWAWEDKYVSVPVADLRLADDSGGIVLCTLSGLRAAHEINPAIYSKAPSIFCCHDNPQQETQLLFGERILVEPFSCGWLRVKTIEQKVFKDDKWQPITGFIRAQCVTDCPLEHNEYLTVIVPWASLYRPNKKEQPMMVVSFGTCLACKGCSATSWIVDTPLGCAVIEKSAAMLIADLQKYSGNQLATSIIEAGHFFLGSPYCWGGCSVWAHSMNSDSAVLSTPFLDDQITSVDCSGLLYLLFKAHGLLIPRNANDQFLMCEAVAFGGLLRPGDFIFWGNSQRTPPRVGHVAMYIGKDEHGKDLILECHGKQAPYGVRVIPTSEYARLENKELKELSSGQVMHWTFEGNPVSDIVYFGSFFTPAKIEQLRNAFFEAKRQR